VKLQLLAYLRRFAGWAGGGPPSDTYRSKVRDDTGPGGRVQTDGGPVADDTDDQVATAAEVASASADVAEARTAAAAGEPVVDEPDGDVRAAPGLAPGLAPGAAADEQAADEQVADLPTGHEPAADAPATVAPVTSDEPGQPAGRPGPLPGDATLDPAAVASAARRVVLQALREDLPGGVDVTAAATIPPAAIGRAEVVARQPGVIAGTDLVALVYDQVDPRVTVEMYAADGDIVVAGEVLGVVAGPLRSIVTGERTALNLVGHLSGVATATRQLVDAVAGTGCVVRDTRKTTPGLRLLEKAAVAAAGGVNHRVGLSDALLVKDNHVAAAGSVTAAVTAALAYGGGLHVQVEVDTLDELEAAIAAGARDLLLDNLDIDTTRVAVDRCRQLSAELGERILLESSGTVRLDTIRGYAEAGVDRIAVGAITHSSPQVDVALDIALAGVAGNDDHEQEG
jgi:nicotinate-nucleotide pyrophosphorylase (carboxylating)